MRRYYVLSASMINYPSRRRKMKPRFKANSVMQWIDWNKTTINPRSLPWKSEISGAAHQHNQVLQQAGRQMKSRWISKFLKFTAQQNFRIFALFNQGTVSLEQY